MIYVGYLGLNGTEIPAVVRAVSYLFRELLDHERGLFLSTGRQYPGFAPCDSAMLLRALLRLGFQDDDRVRAACERHLEAVKGDERDVPTEAGRLCVCMGRGQESTLAQ